MISAVGVDLAPEDPIGIGGVDQDYRHEHRNADQHEELTGFGGCGLPDRDATWHDVRIDADAQTDKTEKEQHQRKQKWLVVVPGGKRSENQHCRQRYRNRHRCGDDDTRPFEPALEIRSFQKRRREADRNDRRQRRGSQPPGKCQCPLLQVFRGLHDEPGRAEKRVPGDDRDARQNGERRQPVPPAAAIGSTADHNALKDRPKGNALARGGNERAAEKGDVPEKSSPVRAPAELEGNAAKDKAEQHADDGHVDGRHQDCVSERESRHQPAPAQNKPRLVAVPDWSDRVHHHVAVVPVRKERKQQGDAEVEAVEHDIGEDREGDDKGKDGGDIQREGHHPCSAWNELSLCMAGPGVMPAARMGSPSRGPSSPGCGG